MTFSKKKLLASQIAIEVQLGAEELEKHKSEAIAGLAKDLHVKGFGDGHIPGTIAEKHLGEVAIFQEIVRCAVAEAYLQIVKQENLDVIGEYLQKSGKTEQELLNSFAKEAEQRVKRFLVLLEIANKEGIKPTQEEIEQEANTILQHYKDMRKAKPELDPFRLKEYTEGVLRQEKTLQFLEQFAQS